VDDDGRRRPGLPPDPAGGKRQPASPPTATAPSPAIPQSRWRARGARLLHGPEHHRSWTAAPAGAPAGPNCQALAIGLGLGHAYRPIQRVWPDSARHAGGERDRKSGCGQAGPAPQGQFMQRPAGSPPPSAGIGEPAAAPFSNRGKPDRSCKRLRRRSSAGERLGHAYLPECSCFVLMDPRSSVMSRTFRPCFFPGRKPLTQCLAHRGTTASFAFNLTRLPRYQKKTSNAMLTADSPPSPNLLRIARSCFDLTSAERFAIAPNQPRPRDRGRQRLPPLRLSTSGLADNNRE
jgi:hypothetical protein